MSLADNDPQLRHIDYAWSSTVHGAQGSTADGVIAVLDSSHRALTDQSTFYVQISRAQNRAAVLTDNLEELVAVLEANTGEKATALDAVGEPIETDVETLARRIPEKGPVWTPREEWEALEARARREATVAFRTDGYDALIDRARRLSERPELPAPAREVVDGLLAYDRRLPRGRRGGAGVCGAARTRMARPGAASRRRPRRTRVRSPGWRTTPTGARARRS